jgi:nicotinamide-nucleotide amidase
MINAAIVSIGNELLSGTSVDTNSAWLSQRLLPIGIPTVLVCRVGDDCPAIVKALRSASIESQIIIVSGGLGPTDDDLTRQAISEYCGRKLKLDEASLADIESFFAGRDKKMPERNKMQAYIPEGAQAIKNDMGTAPGIVLVEGEKMLFALPGVPAEMKRMFEKFVLPRLKKLEGRSCVSACVLKCFGKGESDIAQMLGDSMQRGRNPLVNTTVRDGVITLHIVAQAGDKEQADKIARNEQNKIAEILGDVVFTKDDISLAEAIAVRLTELGRTVATAESCTGGLVAKLLTDVPGSSNYFLAGWVAYSNQAKIRELGVPAELIEEKGAVSEAVASALADGARRKAGADYGIGITGIAGPGGATADKSVGLVYIAVASGRGVNARKFLFGGDRNSVRKRAANTALDLLRRNI